MAATCALKVYVADFTDEYLDCVEKSNSGESISDLVRFQTVTVPERGLNIWFMSFQIIYILEFYFKWRVMIFSGLILRVPFCS
jgi:hypothetical protein